MTFTETEGAGHVSASDLPHYSKNTDDPIYFYGGTFSNFVPSVFQAEPMNIGDVGYNLESMTFWTVEHWFAAHKAIGRAQFLEISRGKGPGQAKARGRACDLRPDWESVKYRVMVQGLRYKFSGHTASSDIYRKELLDTGDRRIAEDSPTDFIWGIQDGKGGLTGQNLLGRALMHVRHEIVLGEGPIGVNDGIYPDGFPR